MDPNLFPPKGRELVSAEWCLKGEHLHGGTRTTLAHTRTRRTRGTGTEEVRAWRHDVSAHVRGVGVGGVWEFSACAAGSRGEAGERRPAVETARVPGMPRGGGVGSNEFEWGAAALSAPFSSDAWSHQSSGTEGITCASGAPRRDRAEKSPKNRQKIT